MFSRFPVLENSMANRRHYRRPKRPRQIHPAAIPYNFSTVSSSLLTDFRNRIRVTIPTTSRFTDTNMAPTLESVSTATLNPALSTIPTRSVHTNPDGLVRIQVSNTSNEGNDDDVVYLYSVSRRQLVEVIDVSENNQDASVTSTASRDFILSSTPEEHETPTHGNLDDLNSILRSLAKNDVSVTCVSGENSKDPKASSTKEGKRRKRKRSDDGSEARCNLCEKNYESLINSGNELFSSRCGHLFCLSCLKTLIPYNCTKCNEKISNLWKIFL